MALASQSIKLVVVGTDGVGKTCLLLSYTTNRFPHDYIPTAIDFGTVSLKDPSGRNPQLTYSLGLFDTAAHAEYDFLRPLAYPQTDIFLLCFDICNPSTYEDIRTKWNPEVRHHRPDALMAVVGTKRDLRRDGEDSTGQLLSAQRSLTWEQGAALTREIGALGYFECSALTGEGVKETFLGAAHLVLDNRSRPQAKTSDRHRCVVG